jgi:hypothetical protein
MKSFRKQMTKVISERYRSDGAESQKHYLDEATTHSAETLITYIRQWPTPSRNQVLARLMECRRWNDKGQIVLECDFKGKPYPCKLPLKLAYEAYQFGDQRNQVWPMYNFPEAIKHIPANVTEDWLEEIKHLFYDINKLSVKAAKLINLGQQIKLLGLNNPYTFAGWNRQIEEFIGAQKAIDEYVAGKKDLEYLSTKNLQNPKHGQEMSKILEDILAKADETVEPSFKCIREQDRRLHVRQDATYARNNVKSVAGFFKKYEAEQPDLISSLGNMINFVETHNV